jgi:hypothetical protein
MAADSERIAILNGFGITIGDSIIGLQALRLAQELGAISGRPILFRRPGVRPIVEAVYALADDFAEARPFPPDLAPERTPPPPWPPDHFAKLIDIRDFAFDPGFRGVAMIDYFLGHLGVKPERIDSACKRNAWLGSRHRPVVSPDLPRNYILVCPRTSIGLRDMPEVIHGAIVDWLLTNSDATVVTQTQASPDMDRRVLFVPSLPSFADICGLVAGARLVVSTDTAMVHLADAFMVPCLAFYTTHDPRWRVRDYPLCTPVYLPPVGLPPALEFPRDAADVAAVRAAWFPDGSDLGWLHKALDRSLKNVRP